MFRRYQTTYTGHQCFKSLLHKTTQDNSVTFQWLDRWCLSELWSIVLTQLGTSCENNGFEQLQMFWTLQMPIWALPRDIQSSLVKRTGSVASYLSLLQQIPPKSEGSACNLSFCSLKSFSLIMDSLLNNCHLTREDCIWYLSISTLRIPWEQIFNGYGSWMDVTLHSSAVANSTNYDVQINRCWRSFCRTDSQVISINSCTGRLEYSKKTGAGNFASEVRSLLTLNDCHFYRSGL